MTKLIINWQQTYQEVSSKLISKSLQYGLLTIVLILTLLVRLATINTPQLKWTEWKEIDYIAISQNFLKHGFNFFLPEVSWPAEPPRVTEMEFPLVPYTAALLYKFFGFNDYTVRAVTLFASLLMVLYVYKLTKRELGIFQGLLAALAAGALPLYNRFSRFLFTEPMMIALSVVSLYYLAEWVEYERRRDGYLAFISFSLTIALKLESLYLLLPVAWIAFRKYRWEVSLYKNMFIRFTSAFILPVLWYSYAYYLENTGAHLFGIFKGHNKSQMLSMLSKFDWYSTMAHRVFGGILGGQYGTFLFIFGVVAAIKLKKIGLFFAYLIAVGIYFVVIAEGNIDAPYRQLTLIPPAAVFVAMGAQAIIVMGITIYRTFLRDEDIRLNHFYFLLLASLLLVMIIPLINYKSIFYEDLPAFPDRWNLAQLIDRFSNDQTKLIVIGESDKHLGGYDLSPVLYYYSNRQGWTLTPVDWKMDKIEELRRKGAGLLVVVPRFGNHPNSLTYQIEDSPDSIINEIKTHYSVMYESHDQIIFDLKSPVK